ncbi:Otud4, partial [Symbiodinium sp. CCMP2592]
EHFQGTFTLKKMRGDGNCLFHALADKSRQSGVELREQIMRFLEQNAVHQEHEEQADAWLREADYLRSDPHNWGGDTAIVAFSLMNQQSITLHWRGEDGTIQSIDRTHENVPGELREQDVLHLWYNGQNHYDLLVPSNPEQQRAQGERAASRAPTPKVAGTFRRAARAQ